MNRDYMQPVAFLHVGGVYGDELEEWELEAEQVLCDELNEKHINKPTALPLYLHPPAADVQPVAWSVFDKRTQKHWYTNESVNTAGYYAKEYSHREADGSPSMSVVPLYENPQKPLTDDQIDALVLPESGTGTVRDLVRIVEAAHGIGSGK